MTTMDDTQEIDADALRARLAEMAQRGREEMGAVADDPRDEIARLRALLEVAQTSLAAATSGRRVTACDEIERLQRERDALRDAAREMLAALEAPAPVWDADESEHDEHAARLTAATDALRPLVVGDTTARQDLPAEAVVSCPACGVDITADLTDGAEYITRRHSRREPARIGLGDIVWCDGGVVRAVTR